MYETQPELSTADDYMHKIKEYSSYKTGRFFFVGLVSKPLNDGKLINHIGSKQHLVYMSSSRISTYALIRKLGFQT
jgi:hypothetical protein